MATAERGTALDVKLRTKMSISKIYVVPRLDGYYDRYSGMSITWPGGSCYPAGSTDQWTVQSRGASGIEMNCSGTPTDNFSYSVGSWPQVVEFLVDAGPACSNTATSTYNPYGNWGYGKK